MADTTLFRKAIRSAVAEAADIPDVLDRWVDAPVMDAAAVCAAPGGWVPNAENRFFRMYSFTVRILLPKDPTVGPIEDDRGDALEEVAEAVLAALPQSPNVGGSTGWIYYVDEVTFDMDRVSVDFSFSVELQNDGEF